MITNNRGNNNGNNNRRRGRGNNNNRQNGGGAQLNRVDSRARGNAPQMLEKYRKLAHDAHLNGDRVQEEYYLQFADHYFRVIADTRVRQEEQRTRPNDRGEGGEEQADENEFSTSESEYQPYEKQGFDRQQPYDRQQNAPRDRDERGNREERAPREERQQREDRGPREDRQPREDRGPREDRAPRFQRPVQEDRAPSADAPTRDVTDEQQSAAPAGNPFVRGSRGLKPRRDDRAARAPREEPVANAAEETPAPKRRGRPAKAKVEAE